MKFAFFALMIISGIICVVDIVIADWWNVFFTGATILWLFNTYRLVSINYDCIAELNKLLVQLSESHTRENIAKQELNKMRERAQEAEKKYLALVNDTPARGKDGKFVKREE